MSTEKLADALRVEIDLIVGEPGSFAGEEARRNYLLVRERGTEHDSARHFAIGAAVGTLRSRQIAAAAANYAGAASRWMSQAHAIEAAFMREVGMIA